MVIFLINLLRAIILLKFLHRIGENVAFWACVFISTPKLSSGLEEQLDSLLISWALANPGFVFICVIVLLHVFNDLHKCSIVIFLFLRILGRQCVLFVHIKYFLDKSPIHISSTAINWLHLSAEFENLWDIKNSQGWQPIFAEVVHFCAW